MGAEETEDFLEMRRLVRLRCGAVRHLAGCGRQTNRNPGRFAKNNHKFVHPDDPQRWLPPSSTRSIPNAWGTQYSAENARLQILIFQPPCRLHRPNRAPRRCRAIIDYQGAKVKRGEPFPLQTCREIVSDTEGEWR